MEADLGLIQKLANLPVEHATIIVDYDDNRHEQLSAPSRVWRQGTKIFVRVEMQGDRAIEDIHQVNLRLDQQRLVSFPVPARQAPFGIEIELGVAGPAIGWDVGTPKKVEKKK